MTKRKDKVFTDNGYNTFSAKNDKQKEYFNLIKTKDLVFAIGSAGSGKTAVAASSAAQALKDGHVDSVVICRPAIEAAGERLGFIPGDSSDKIAPYFAPVRSIFEEILGKSQVEMKIKEERIQAVPMAYLRGLTFKNSFMILDEAQSVTRTQMELFLTRAGEGSNVVITGDIRQRDNNQADGLEDAMQRLSWMPQYGEIVFTRNDCVRAGWVSDIITSYEDK